MIKIRTIALAGLALLATLSISYADIPTTPATAASPLIIPPAPNINAKAWVIMDATTGKILAQKDMGQRRQPASLTKLMTLLVTFQALKQDQIKLDDKVTISHKAWNTGGSRMFLKLGSHVDVADLIRGIITASGNDACVALSQYIAGNQNSFAQLMNLTAKRIGMNNSHFVDATGLPRPQHYATAHDLAILARTIITQYPEYYHFFNEKWITWNHIKQPNRNRLLWRDPSVDGMKTGHTKDAGYCLIASGKKHNMRLITVVLGAPSDTARANDSQALLNWGYRFYNTYTLYKANTAIANARVWLGQSKSTPLGLTDNITTTIPVGAYKNLKASMTIKSHLKAPIIKGQPYGKITVRLNGNIIAQAPLVALQPNQKGSLWSRMTDHFELFFKG